MKKQTFYGILSGDATLAALVGDRIYHMRLPQGCPMPAFVYSRVSLTPDANLEDDGDNDSSRFQTDSWSDSDVEAEAVFEAARNALKNSGYKVSLLNSTDYHEAETDLHRVNADFIGWEK